MASQNQFEIDNAWEEVQVTSRMGDFAHYKINAITKQVLIRTKVGDGNQQDWRGCNVSYEAVKRLRHTVVNPANQDFVPANTADHNGHAESKAPKAENAPPGTEWKPVPIVPKTVAAHPQIAPDTNNAAPVKAPGNNGAPATKVLDLESVAPADPIFGGKRSRKGASQENS